MNTLLVITLWLGSFTVTSYRSVPNQTDSSPFITSIGENTNEHGVAVSQDLLKRGLIRYGDLVYIENIGFKHVNDCMGETQCVQWQDKKCAKRVPIKNQFDVWVKTKQHEIDFDKHYRNKKLKVWLVYTKGTTVEYEMYRKARK